MRVVLYYTEKADRIEENIMKMDIITIGKLTIHGYGLMIAIGILCCVAVAMYRAKLHGLNQEAIIDIAIYGVISGFVGAKLLFVIVEFNNFVKNPSMILGSEGFVVYGGIIAGVLAAILYCKKKKLVFLQYFDLAAPSIAIAQGFGRIGCFLAGCCYGRETKTFLGVTFPAESMAPSGVKLLPTQLFSSIGDFVIAGVLIFYSGRCKKDGNVGAMYMVLYGIGRFLIEFLRSDERGGFGMFSTSQWISFAVVAGGFVIFAWNKKRDSVLATKLS